MPIVSPFPILTGPTGVGKTACSLKIAEELGAEIISVDSRQIYRELTIGSAKPTEDELARVPHHFINELHLGETISAGSFAERANRRIQEILQRGRSPLVVGGSTLYLHALQFGLASIPARFPALRQELEERLTKEGAETLYKELQRIDPAIAATLDTTKTHRVIRALEIYYSTGQPQSAYYSEHRPPPYSYRVVVLYTDRKVLYERINARVDAMLEQGLLGEVQKILETGTDPSLYALRTIGYREAISFLQGDISFDEMVRLIRRNSRRYAKRQLTWFRRYPEYHWVDVKDIHNWTWSSS